MADEIWKPVVGYEGLYEVSNVGNIKNRNNHILASEYHHGYKSIKLCKYGTIKRYFVHRLVADAFIPNLENKPFINHIDENKENNRVENLEWCTASYNSSYGTRPERLSKHFKNYPKYSKAVVKVDSFGNETVFPSISEAARDIDVLPGNISHCCYGRLKEIKGYTYRFV